MASTVRPLGSGAGVAADIGFGHDLPTATASPTRKPIRAETSPTIEESGQRTASNAWVSPAGLRPSAEPRRSAFSPFGLKGWCLGAAWVRYALHGAQLQLQFGAGRHLREGAVVPRSPEVPGREDGIAEIEPARLDIPKTAALVVDDPEGMTGEAIPHEGHSGVQPWVFDKAPMFKDTAGRTPGLQVGNVLSMAERVDPGAEVDRRPEANGREPKRQSGY